MCFTKKFVFHSAKFGIAFFDSCLNFCVISKVVGDDRYKVFKLLEKLNGSFIGCYAFWKNGTVP